MRPLSLGMGQFSGGVNGSSPSEVATQPAARIAQSATQADEPPVAGQGSTVESAEEMFGLLLGQMMLLMSSALSLMMSLLLGDASATETSAPTASDNNTTSPGSSPATATSARQDSTASSAAPTSAASSAQTAASQTASEAATPAAASGRDLRGITPNQFELGDPDQSTMCGIVAGLAYANFLGKNVSVAEMKQAAIDHGGWTAGAGMGGWEGQKRMMQQFGIETELELGVDWDKVAQTVQSGVPVIITSPGHYFVVEGYDPQTGKFDFGNSAKILSASGGQTQFTKEEMMSGVLGERRIPDGTMFLVQ